MENPTCLQNSSGAFKLLDYGPPSPSTSTSSEETADEYRLESERTFARDLPTWKLFLEFEKRKMKLESDSLYFVETYHRIEGIVQAIGLDFEELHQLSPDQLQELSQLPPEVLKFFMRYQQCLADEREIRMLWTVLQRRGWEHFTGERFVWLLFQFLVSPCFYLMLNVATGILSFFGLGCLCNDFSGRGKED